MIAADTNLVIRHLTNDDEAQAARVGRLFGEAARRREPVFIGQLVLCEVCWVLKAVYQFSKPDILLAVHALLEDGGFAIQERAQVEQAAELYRQLGGQFPDHLIGVVAKAQGSQTTYTLDRAAARQPNFTLLP